IKELIVEYKHQSFLGMNIISKTEEWQTEKRDEFLVENSETRKQESAKADQKELKNIVSNFINDENDTVLATVFSLWD
ncbi:MAG: hypothetical protein ACRCUS_02840, partial [Anaerovoracaceae bacterium]